MDTVTGIEPRHRHGPGRRARRHPPQHGESSARPTRSARSRNSRPGWWSTRYHSIPSRPWPTPCTSWRTSHLRHPVVERGQRPPLRHPDQPRRALRPPTRSSRRRAHDQEGPRHRQRESAATRRCASSICTASRSCCRRTRLSLHRPSSPSRTSRRRSASRMPARTRHGACAPPPPRATGEDGVARAAALFDGRRRCPRRRHRAWPFLTRRPGGRAHPAPLHTTPRSSPATSPRPRRPARPHRCGRRRRQGRHRARLDLHDPDASPGVGMPASAVGDVCRRRSGCKLERRRMRSTAWTTREEWPCAVVDDEDIERRHRRGRRHGRRPSSPVPVAAGGAQAAMLSLAGMREALRLLDVLER